MKAHLDDDDIKAVVNGVVTALKPFLACNCRQTEDKFLSIEEAAEFLRTTKGQIYQWVSNSRHGLSPSPIPFQKAGKRLLFSQKALAEWTIRGNQRR